MSQVINRTGASRESSPPDVAVILAGGLGTRLRPAVAKLPKILAPVGGTVFLDYLLEYLSSQGVRRVILSVGYLAELVRKYAGTGARWALEITYVFEEAPLGTGGAMRLASQSLTTPFFGMNGDTLFQISLAEFWREHLSGKACAAIALRQTETAAINFSRGGCVILDEKNRILAFDEKPSSPTWPQDQSPLLINGGVYLLNPDSLELLKPGLPASLERDVFPRLAAAGNLAGFPQQGYFIDIGTPSSLAAFEQDIMAGLFRRTHWQHDQG